MLETSAERGVGEPVGRRFPRGTNFGPIFPYLYGMIHAGFGIAVKVVPALNLSPHRRSHREYGKWFAH